MAEITVVGGINIDIEGSPFEKLKYHDSNPGRIHLAFGGVGRNITENAARLGGDVAMVSVIGDDQMGQAAKAELAKHGLSCDGKRAVQLQKSDYDKYDLFIGMDSANIRNMLRIFGGDPDGKVHKLLDYTDRGGNVADPWYSERFDVAYRDIYEGCTALLDAVLKQDKQEK